MNLEPVLGGDDTIRRNFSKIQDLFAAPAQARVFNSGNISVNNDTATALTFDSERFDTGGFHSTSTNTGRLTVPTAGLYFIGACIRFAADADGYRRVGLRINGTTTIASVSLRAADTGDSDVIATTEYQLAATDYVEVVVRHTAGAATNVLVQGNLSPEFWIHRIGSTA